MDSTGNNGTTDKCATERNRCKNCGGKNHSIELCPHKEQGTRCFRCSGFGHIGKNCLGKLESSSLPKNTAEKTEETNEVDVQQAMGGLHLSSWRLSFQHGSATVKAVICLNIQESFIRKSCVNGFDYRPRVGGPRALASLHNEQVQTLGSYEFHMTNDDVGHYIKCHVVQDEAIHEQMWLGMDFLETVEIVVRKGNVMIRRITNESHDGLTSTDEKLDWSKSAK